MAEEIANSPESKEKCAESQAGADETPPPAEEETAAPVAEEEPPPAAAEPEAEEAPPAEPDRDLRIERTALSEVVKWPKNPKGHDHAAITASFERFGFVSPVIVNETTGQLIAGHGRIETLERAQNAGQPPPAGVLDQDGEWLVPVVRGVELPEHDADAYAIADNRLVELGAWDDEALSAVLAEQYNAGTLDGTGFTENELSEILSYQRDPLSERNDEQSVEIKAQVTIPPRVWLTMRDQLQEALGSVVDDFGVEIKWPS